MRAVYYEEFGTPDVLKLGERPVPTPAADEVLVQVAAAGVNPIDRRLRNGELQSFFRAGMSRGASSMSARVSRAGRRARTSSAWPSHGRCTTAPMRSTFPSRRHRLRASPASSPSLRQLPCRS
jgi:hypothetical protein